MRMFMKRAVSRLAIVAALVGLAMPAAHADDKELLVAEPTHGVGYLPLYVAIRNGYFAAEGINVKVVTIDSGAGHTNAVLSGQAFAFIGGPEHNAFAKLKGAELRAVVNVVDRGNVYFVARTGKEPKPGEDLASYMKGKSIAVGPFSGTPNSITRYYLKKWGLDAKTDVTLNEMATSAVIAAVRAGKSDVGVTSEPFIKQGVKEGFWSEPFLNVPKDLGPYAYSTLNVRLDSIKSDPQLVAKFVKGVIKGLKFTYADPEGATKIAKAEFPTMNQDDLKATLDRTFADELWSKDGFVAPAAWTTAASVVLSAGILKQDVPYEDIIDMQFVKQNQAAAQ